MEKKSAKLALIVLFLAALYLPFALWAGLGSRLTGENRENRTLAEWPAFDLSRLSALPGQYEKYFNDHLPFRSPLISLHAELSSRLFDTSSSDSVILGKEDWLFYSRINDGDPAASYRGEDLFTMPELRQIAADLCATRDALKKRGIEFVLFIAPNKERMYAEYMPDRYGPPAEEYAARQLADFLRKRTDLRVVYPYEELMEAKAAFPDLPLYYSNDTHWNGIGAYVGARALLAELGVSLPPLSRENISQTADGYVGDLADMLNITRTAAQYTVSVPGAASFKTAETEDSPVLVTSTGRESGRLFLRRDSFGEAMIPYLAPWFSHAAYVNTLEYDQAQADEARPTVYVMEVVERYLHKRLTKGPLYE